MALSLDPGITENTLGFGHVGDSKAHRIQRHALSVHLSRDAKLVAEGNRLNDLDLAMRGRGLDAERARMQIADTSEALQEDMMIARIVGDHHHPGHAGCAVGMKLERRIPEILRKML